MLLADVVDAWRAVGRTSARSAKVALLADLLRRTAPADSLVVVPWLSGELRQRRTGIGWAALRDAPGPADRSALTVAAVDAAFEQAATVAGAGSANRRRELVAEMFGAATADEQQFLRGLVSGELRAGALEGVVVEAIAAAARVPVAAIRRAVMLRGQAAPVAAAVLERGPDGLSAFRLEVGQPVQPMLASTAPSVADALARLGEAALEWKLDGIRAQVHVDAGDVRVFTRSLDDITRRVPEIVTAAAALPVTSAVFDGEAIALRVDGRPRPFQETGARVASQPGVAPGALSWFVFDVLHLDGDDVLDLPGAERQQALASVVAAPLRVPRVVTASAEQAAAFFDDAVTRGHEGVVVKSLTAPYEAGRRGSGWLKVKPVHTLDLVVLAAEWGHGRRRGWLSNLHLGARDPRAQGWVMLGKTFKGLTDDMLRWQTERLLSLETARNEWQVFVRPELVVEIAFDGVQTSPRYPGGVALRFARVVRYREDKPAEQADTIDAVRALQA